MQMVVKNEMVDRLVFAWVPICPPLGRFFLISIVLVVPHGSSFICFRRGFNPNSPGNSLAIRAWDWRATLLPEPNSMRYELVHKIPCKQPLRRWLLRKTGSSRAWRDYAAIISDGCPSRRQSPSLSSRRRSRLCEECFHFRCIIHCMRSPAECWGMLRSLIAGM